MNTIKRISVLALTTLLAISMTACQKKEETNAVSQTANTEFDSFVDAEFKELLESDYTTIQQLIAHPETYDVDQTSIKVQLGEPWSEDSYEDDVASFEKSKENFQAFDRATLDSEQQVTYDIIADQIELSEKTMDKKYEYMGNYFGSISGIQSNLMTVFTEFTIYSEQDLKDLVVLMNDTKPYLASLNDYMKKQKDAGTFISNYNVEQLAEYCDKIISGDEGKAMVAVVQKNIDAYEGIDATTKTTYKQQVEDAFANSIIPAYQAMKDTANSLKSDDNNQMGLASIKNGKEYYELLFRDATGSSKTIKEWITLLDAKTTSLLQNMSTVITKNPEAYSSLLSGETTSGFDNYMDMLAALEEWEKTDFPAVELPDYEAVPAPDTVSDGVAAYYLIPRIDSNDINKIRVNEKNGDVTSLDTIHTIAHEGMPGHLYQTNYAYQNIKVPYRLIACNYLGYTEGYANYAAAMASSVSKADESIVELNSILSDLNWALSARVDIGIHYEGWTKDEASKALDKFGMGAVVDSIYDDIQTNPAAYLPYGIGYFEILDIKEAAQKELGDKFTELGFNTALLKSGAAPFSIVQKNIDTYVEITK